MKHVVSAQDMRALEAPALEAGRDLMLAASLAVAEVVRDLAPTGTVVVACGPGNNGGDGLYAAADLADGRDVAVWFTHGAGHEAGLAAAEEAGCRVVDAPEATGLVAEAAVVVDAVFGIGARQGLPDAVATFTRACSDMGVPVVSVDLPSGLSTDAAAAPDDAFRADVTVTFEALKPCHVLAPAALGCGEVVVAPLDLDDPTDAWVAIEPADVARWWPVPDPTGDKYARGVVGLDTGSATYPGAALLGCGGALGVGTGMVRYLGSASGEFVVGRFPSVVTADGRVQAMVLGSGWGDGEDNGSRLAAAAERGVPLVLDADALRLVRTGLPEGSLATPHAGELARMLEVERAEVEADPVGHAVEAARRFGLHVLLKGGNQVVAGPDGSVAFPVRGPAWTAQAGSGDTLAGACGALLAAGCGPQQAALLAASVQAMTAARFGGPHRPEELAAGFGDTIADLLAVG